MNIAISGKIGSGKTTSAKYISDRYGHKIISLATPLKKLASFSTATSVRINGNAIIDSLFSNIGNKTSGKVLYRALRIKFKEELENEEKPRIFLQTLGQVFRSIEEDCWVNYLLKRCDKDSKYICDDLRYKNELAAFQRNNWSIIRIESKEEIRSSRVVIPEGASNHPSETDLDEYADSMMVLINDSNSINDLYSKLHSAFMELKYNAKNNSEGKNDEKVQT